MIILNQNNNGYKIIYENGDYKREIGFINDDKFMLLDIYGNKVYEYKSKNYNKFNKSINNDYECRDERGEYSFNELASISPYLDNKKIIEFLNNEFSNLLNLDINLLESTLIANIDTKVGEKILSINLYEVPLIEKDESKTKLKFNVIFGNKNISDYKINYVLNMLRSIKKLRIGGKLIDYIEYDEDLYTKIKISNVSEGLYDIFFLDENNKKICLANLISKESIVHIISNSKTIYYNDDFKKTNEVKTNKGFNLMIKDFYYSDIKISEISAITTWNEDTNVVEEFFRKLAYMCENYSDFINYDNSAIIFKLTNKSRDILAKYSDIERGALYLKIININDKGITIKATNEKEITNSSFVNSEVVKINKDALLKILLEVAYYSEIIE
ncbi:hypothetical protein [Clostridium mediterraneense]|uniref:hypothetical protein n=1 Tax=Clostridium mediterraneense TaxID=1805472 RepID=UPI000830552B|nr:hypothetical protein [Clostridium mediterraneense]